MSGVPAALDRAARAGVWSVAVDERADQSIYDLTVADQRIMVVLGAEGRGLARLTRERCDVPVRIPMRGPARLAERRDGRGRGVPRDRAWPCRRPLGARMTRWRDTPG